MRKDILKISTLITKIRDSEKSCTNRQLCVEKCGEIFIKIGVKIIREKPSALRKIIKIIKGLRITNKKIS